MQVFRSIASAFVIMLLLPLSSAAEQPVTDSDSISPTTLPVLSELARKKINANPRIGFAVETEEFFRGAESLDTPGSEHIPNYLRALSSVPGSVKPFAHMVKTFIYSGTIVPEVKIGMGLRIAQLYSGAYVAAHMRRLLSSTEHGKAILNALESGKFDSLAPTDRLALRYAELLSQDVHGVNDSDFRATREYFNDSQVVELTLTTCFFNYFTRFTEALNLPVEAWALEPANKLATADYEAPIARVALISNDELQAAAQMLGGVITPAAQASTLGMPVVNSMRAMNRVPQLAQAFRAYGASARETAQVSREILLQVSFAVSMANGCRYCSLHQVLGLRRLGVDPTKLVQMKKDDSALTPRELIAVLFARKLTREPASVTDADYQTLRNEFGDRGALDIVMQTCNFAFMNRFTDGLRLPSEDLAVRIYRETYGADWAR